MQADVNASASSAGEIELQGKTRSLDIDASSAGQIDAYDLEAQKVTAEASSAGSLKINVVNELMPAPAAVEIFVITEIPTNSSPIQVAVVL